MKRKTAFSTKFVASDGIANSGDKATFLYPDSGAGVIMFDHDDVESFDACIANIKLLMDAPKLYRLLEESLEVTAKLWAELAEKGPSAEIGESLADFERRASTQLNALLK